MRLILALSILLAPLPAIAGAPCFHVRKQFVVVDNAIQYQAYAAPSYGGSYQQSDDLLRRILEKLEQIDAKLGEQQVRNLTAESVITARCASCHNPAKPSGKLTLVDGGGKLRLLSAEERRWVKTLVETSDDKIRMPKGKPPLAEAERKALLDWLEKEQKP